jgi:hypothetical protein
MTVLFYTEGKDTGDSSMATKVFHIELRCPGVEDPEKLKTLKESVRVAARNLFGMAMLVTGDDTKPVIACYSEDFITGQEEIVVKQYDAVRDDD